MKTKLRNHEGRLMLTFQPCGYKVPIELPVITRGLRDGTGSWTWNGDREKPTLRPSIKTTHSNGLVSHLWLNDGVCEHLKDSTDEYKGLVLPLWDIEGA